MSDEAEIMTMSEVCGYLRVHPSTIYRLLKKKELLGFRVGADWRFRREEIDRAAPGRHRPRRYTDGHNE